MEKIKIYCDQERSYIILRQDGVNEYFIDFLETVDPNVFSILKFFQYFFNGQVEIKTVTKCFDTLERKMRRHKFEDIVKLFNSEDFNHKTELIKFIQFCYDARNRKILNKHNS